MTKPGARQFHLQNDRPVLQSCYVLRLWWAQSGELYGYVLDVRSGIRHPLSRLAELPALIRSLVAKSDANEE